MQTIIQNHTIWNRKIACLYTILKHTKTVSFRPFEAEYEPSDQLLYKNLLHDTYIIKCRGSGSRNFGQIRNRIIKNTEPV